MGREAGKAAAVGSETSLATLRADIDRIDHDLHRLLMERAEVVGALVAAKGVADDGIVVRPEREAAILARRAEDHAGALPFPVIAHVWRTMIATFCRLQRPFDVVLGGADPVVRDLARFHFGFDVQLRPAADPEAVLAVLRDAPGDVALLPLGPADTPWWERLDGADGTHALTRLSEAVIGETGPGALVVGGARVGDAGSGRTLWGVRGGERPRPTSGAPVLLLAHLDGTAYLLEADGALAADEVSRAAGLSDPASALTRLGAFRPLPDPLGPISG